MLLVIIVFVIINRLLVCQFAALGFGMNGFTYMVPPALSKIGELVLKCHFPNFEKAAQEQTQIGVTQQQSLCEPADDMGEHKLIVHRVLCSCMLL